MLDHWLIDWLIVAADPVTAYLVTEVTLNHAPLLELCYKLHQCRTKRTSVRHAVFTSLVSAGILGCVVSLLSCSFHGDKMRGSSATQVVLLTFTACWEIGHMEHVMALYCLHERPSREAPRAPLGLSLNYVLKPHRPTEQMRSTPNRPTWIQNATGLKCDKIITSAQI